MKGVSLWILVCYSNCSAPACLEQSMQGLNPHHPLRSISSDARRAVCSRPILLIRNSFLLSEILLFFPCPSTAREVLKIGSTLVDFDEREEGCG